MVLTRKMIEAGKSRQGGWSKEHLDKLGVTWPPMKGWADALDGTPIDHDTYTRFLSLKDRHLKPAKR